MRVNLVVCLRHYRDVLLNSFSRIHIKDIHIYTREHKGPDGIIHSIVRSFTLYIIMIPEILHIALERN